jgi:hypothetical protein
MIRGPDPDLDMPALARSCFGRPAALAGLLTRIGMVEASSAKPRCAAAVGWTF